MGHEIRGIVGTGPAIDAFCRIATVRIREPLALGFEFVPLVCRLADDLGLRRGDELSKRFRGFGGLSVGVAETIGVASSAGQPLAFIDSRFSGGKGLQQAALWRDGSCVEAIDDQTLLIADGQSIHLDWPVPRVLTLLGVAAEPGEDSFAALALHRLRDLEDYDEMDPQPETPRR